MELGSLFDGISCFPYSAQRHGITPVWASEIEPSCVSITKRHFPDMKHFGDVTRINGADIEPVDIITFGSPCQDLSVAGKRAGLEGARSGLFGEAIRIIDEMRSNTNAEYPRFAIWENVPGALSSSNGLDFKAVLQSFADCEIPMPDSGRWANAGMVRGGRCDIAWRILDAQYWGVPQRRRRIFLVADFRGQRAAEILFKPESLRGDFAQSREKGQGTAGRAGNGVESTNIMCMATKQIAMSILEDKAPTLGANDYKEPAAVVVCKTNQTGSNGLGICKDTAYTLEAGGVGQAIVLGSTQPNAAIETDLSPTLTEACGKGGGQVPIVFSRQRSDVFIKNDVVSTQSARQYKDATDLICVSDTQRDAKICVDLAPTLTCMHEQPYIVGHAVRRLTPVECERLQGFPNNWTAYGHDGKPISDTKRYAAIGNSVAIPCVDYIMQGIIDVTPKTGK